MEPENKRRVIRRHELFLLILSGLFLLYMGLKAVGVNPVDRGEEVSWMDRPNGPEAPMAKVETKEQIAELDATIQNIAVQFAEDERRDRRTSKTDLRRKGLSADEAEYYKDVRQRENGGTSATDWVETVQTSYQTYKTVKRIFDSVDGRNDDYVGDEEVENILSDPELRNRTLTNMEKTFQIARPQLEAFAKRGGRALNDWATFVDENQGGASDNASSQ